MAPLIEEIMKDLGWVPGFKIPVANTENRKLENEVQQQQQETASLTNKIIDNDNRISSMKDHLKNVQHELQQTQFLLQARHNEIRTEEHMQMVADREIARLQQDMRNMKEQLQNLENICGSMENTIFKHQQKVEELKSGIKWDQEALEAWLEEAAQREEDVDALTKYSKLDEGKMKELTLKLEHLRGEAQQRRQMLDASVTDNQMSQLELDKAAEEFRQAHQERQYLLSKWEETINQMQKRDREIDDLLSQLNCLKQNGIIKEELLKEQQQFLDSETKNNKEMEKKIIQAERKKDKTQTNFQNSDEQRKMFENELEVSKRSVYRTSTDLETGRAKLSELKQQLSGLKSKLENITTTNSGLKKKLDVTRGLAGSAEERAHEMEKMLKAEENHQKQLGTEIARIQDVHYHKTQTLQKVVAEEQVVDMEIRGNEAAKRNLTLQLQELDKEAQHQDKVLYNQDYEIQQLEMQLGRLSGSGTNSEEKQELEKHIQELQNTLDERAATHNLLKQQIKRIQNDVRCVKQNVDQQGLKYDIQQSKIHELKLHNESSQRELKSTTLCHQDLLVDESVLKLEVKRLQKALHSKADEVLTMETQKLELEMALKERCQEISIHSEMLLAKQREILHKNSSLKMDLQDRITKIDNLKKRYEILIMTMGPPDGEQEVSHASVIIKTAQEKEELQQEGDDLDMKIRKAEKEIRALENTVKLISSSNEIYRQSFTSVSENSPEYLEKQQLEDRLDTVLQGLQQKCKLLQELQDDMQAMSQTEQQLCVEEESMVREQEKKRQDWELLQKEVREQQEKLKRINKQNTRLSQEIRSEETSAMVQQERDFELREMYEKKLSAIKQIESLLSQHPEMAEDTRMYFIQAGLTPPRTYQPASRSSSTPSSVRTPPSRRGLVSPSSLSKGIIATRTHSSQGVKSPTSVITFNAEQLGGSSSVTQHKGGKVRSSGGSTRKSPGKR